ncbi:MAG: C40 family peptidase [Bacteroidota bacterium]
MIALLIFSGCSNKLSKRQKSYVVIAEARSYTGTPYKYGGTTNKGMDCSGLLLNSFKAIDYDIPRTSAEQKKEGRRVGKDEIRKGDLVFFATTKKKRKITHVGLVTEVNGGEVIFIHASTSKGVTESSLENAYWSKRFRQARRVI